jgi:hypothetical protein
LPGKQLLQTHDLCPGRSRFGNPLERLGDVALLGRFARHLHQGHDDASFGFAWILAGGI